MPFKVRMRVDGLNVHKVEIIKEDDMMYLGKVWTQFKGVVELTKYDTVIFKFDMKSSLNVTVLNLNMVGKWFKPIGDWSLEVSDSDDDFVFIGYTSSPESKHSSRKRSSSESSKDTFEGKHTIKGVNACDSDGDSYDGHQIQVKDSVTYNKASIYNYNTVHFMTIMEYTYLTGKYFMIALVEVRSPFLNMRTNDQKIWIIKCVINRNHVVLTVGFKDFALRNNLQIGDTCVFSRDEDGESIWDVIIYSVKDHGH